MYDPTDYIIHTNKKGKKTRLYRCNCDECGANKGYMRKNRSQLLCPSCVQKKVTIRKYKEQFLNVDFNDFIAIDRSNGRKSFKFKTYCLSCGSNRGYLSRVDWGNNCKKCSASNINRRIKHSCKLQNILIKDFNGFITPQKKIEREEFVRSGLIKKCFELSNFTCQVCNKKVKKLNAHHIESWDYNHDERFNINNLACLCEECHKRFHNIYGYGSNTIDQFKQFLTDAI